MPDKWDQYAQPAQAAGQDKWEQYADPGGPPAPTSGPVGGVPVPQGLQGKPTPEENNRVALSEGLKGMAKSIPQTVADTGSLMQHIPVIGHSLAPQEGVDYYNNMAEPHNDDQRYGRYAGQALQMLMPMGPAAEALPDAARAGKAIGAVEDAMTAGGHMVPFNKTLPTLQHYNDLREAGAPGVTAADKLFTRSTAMGSTGPHPLPFQQARDLYSNMGMSTAEKMTMKGKMANELPSLQQSFGADIKDAANAAGTNASGMGYGDELARGMQEYRNAQQLKGVGRATGSLVKKSIPYVAGGAGLYELKDKLLGK